jgi:flagellar motor switch protein FliM
MNASTAAPNAAGSSDLLRSVSSVPLQTPSTEPVDYDWSVPHLFVPDEQAALVKFCEKLARETTRAVARLVGEEGSFEADPPAESYAEPLAEELAAGARLAAPISSNGRPAGLIVLPRAAGLAWVARLLGAETAPTEEEQTFGSVERRLLGDIFAALAQAWADAGGPPVTVGEPTVEGAPELPGRKEEAYCRISLVGEGPEGANLLWVVSADVLASVTGRKGEEVPSDQVQARMRVFVEHAVVPATVRLGYVRIAMADLFSLAPGDVLLTENRVTDTAELVVNGAVMAVGTPARNAGRYALRITERLEQEEEAA